MALIGMLGVNVAAHVVLLWAARDPAGSAIEPDYYRKALAWDSTLALHRAAEALGWSAEAALGPPGPGGATLELRLLDRAGAPLRGLWFHVEAIHNAEGPRVATADLGSRERPAEPDAEGTYRMVLPIRRAGWWELRLDARRGRDRFVTSLRLDSGGRYVP